MISIKVDTSELKKAAERFADMKKRAEQQKKLLDYAGVLGKVDSYQRFKSQGPGWPQVIRDGQVTARPLRDTNKLYNNIDHHSYPGQDGSIGTVEVGTAVTSPKNQGAYARAHQHLSDKIITPKKAKYLTIPLAPPLTPFQRRRRFLGDFKNTYLVKMKKRDGYIVYQREGKGEPRAIFLLVKSVKIPSRIFMAWSDKLLQKISNVWSRYILDGTWVN